MPIYALLVGIDDYLSPVPKLRGCVHDIERMQEYSTRESTPAAARLRRR